MEHMTALQRGPAELIQVGDGVFAYIQPDGGYAGWLVPGHRVDVIAALRDMVAYNGGKPLSCHA